MAAQRDTDADWRELGAAQPYWGVLTEPDYRLEHLTPAALDEFYATGVRYIDDMAHRLERATGARPGGRALDFGCGAGRLAEAMTTHAQAVVGYDVSPGMLEKARERGGKATYVETLPDGPFDWINSFIVFQHIPPGRGLALIEQLLARLAPGGHVSLHVTVWRDVALQVPPARGWRKLTRPVLASLNPPAPTGLVSMFDYDLGAVLRLLNMAGVEEMSLISTDHGGHHGVIVLGRRIAAGQRAAA